MACVILYANLSKIYLEQEQELRYTEKPQQHCGFPIDEMMDCGRDRPYNRP